MADATTIGRGVTQRSRTAYACASCRIRKTRCNGQIPCSSCAALAADCVYGTDLPISKGKSDLILNAVLRVERSVGAIESRLSSLAAQPNFNAFVQPSPNTVQSSSHSDQHFLDHVTHSPRTQMHEMDNAVISASHTSNTELVLQWPHFEPFPAIRRLLGESMFRLENHRSKILQRQTVHPYSSDEDIDKTLSSFQQVINFAYPVMSSSRLAQLKAKLIVGDLDDSLTSCLALLTMALGCTGEVMKGMLELDHEPLEATMPPSTRFRSLGHVYFDAAIKKIYHAYACTDTEAAQCLLSAALYCAYLQRPLQAWSFLSTTATKCRVMLCYEIGHLPKEDFECLKRIFWSCYILESDYLAELTALPQFGISETESSVPLPGPFRTHENPSDESLSSLYFLACISMRRLLNRGHHLLFNKDTDTNFDDVRLPGMVEELNDQLTQWKELLPTALQFSIDTDSACSQQGAFLRQRYLVCKALIYRPYMMRAIVDPTCQTPPDAATIDKFAIWLEACLLHMINLGSFDQTVIVDTWIAALSMAGSMLMLLAVCRTPCLRDLLDERVFSIGRRLGILIRRWLYVPGDQSVSPSVERALHIIATVDGLLQEARHAGVGTNQGATTG